MSEPGARTFSHSGFGCLGSASGRVNVAFDLTDTVMAYASYANGQKSGGINMSGLPVYPAGVTGHASGDLPLHDEDVPWVELVSLCPKMALGYGLNQVGRDADSISGP